MSLSSEFLPVPTRAVLQLTLLMNVPLEQLRMKRIISQSRITSIKKCLLLVLKYQIGKKKKRTRLKHTSRREGKVVRSEISGSMTPALNETDRM